MDHSPLFQIIKGSDSIEIRSPPVIQVSFNLAVTVDDFFTTNLINNLAFVLGIEPSHIRVVEVVAAGPRGRRSLLAVNSNSSTVVLELGEPAKLNITEPVTVMVEEQLFGEVEEEVEEEEETSEDSVDVQVREDGGISSCMYINVNSDSTLMCEYTRIMYQHFFTVTIQYTHCLLFLTQTPVSATVPSANPLNDDTPADEISFAAEYNSSAALYADALQTYINEVAKQNNITMVTDKLITLVQTGALTLQNATILGVSVLPPAPPAAPTPPVIPPQFENVIKSGNVTLVSISDPPPPPAVPNGGGDGEEIGFLIPTRLNVSKQPEQEVGTRYPTYIHIKGEREGDGGRMGREGER